MKTETASKYHYDEVSDSIVEYVFLRQTERGQIWTDRWGQGRSSQSLVGSVKEAQERRTEVLNEKIGRIEEMLEYDTTSIWEYKEEEKK